MTEDRFIIDGFKHWSFSRLSAFYQCKKEWHENYVLHPGESEGGAFAEYGSLNHEIFEKYKKGELAVWDCLQYYEDHYGEFVTHDFPMLKNGDMGKKYYDDGVALWEQFSGLLEDHETLGVEKEVFFQIGNYDFIGYIDLLTRDPVTNGLVLTDHKSKNLKILKSGKISKSDLHSFDTLKKQLYLYSKPIIEEYGEEPTTLQWNLFRLRQIYSIPWDRNEYEETLQWATDTIHLIEEEEEWAASPDFFYCRNLCDARGWCDEYRNSDGGSKKSDE